MTRRTRAVSLGIVLLAVAVLVGGEALLPLGIIGALCIASGAWSRDAQGSTAPEDSSTAG